MFSKKAQSFNVIMHFLITFISEECKNSTVMYNIQQGKMHLNYIEFQIMFIQITVFKTFFVNKAL